MRTLFFLIIWLLYQLTCLSQKPPIDSNAFKNWPSVSSPQISENGLYVSYIVDSQPQSIQNSIDKAPDTKSSLVVTDIKKSWKLQVPNVSGNCQFSSNSQHVFFISTDDSLGIIQTGKSAVQYIAGVKSFKITKKREKDLLLYQLKNPQRSLVIKDMVKGDEREIETVQEYELSEDENLLYCKLNNAEQTILIIDFTTGNERRIDFVQQYQLSATKKVLMYLTKKPENSGRQQLHWLDLASGQELVMWQGSAATNFIFDQAYSQCAFIADRATGRPEEKSIWHFKLGMVNALPLAIDLITEGDSLKVENILFFSEDGDRLVVDLKDKDLPQQSPSPTTLTVWSYTDNKLPTVQQNELSPRTYKAIVDLKNSTLIRLEKENEKLTFAENNGGDWGLIEQQPWNFSEHHWRSAPSVSLVSLKSGVRKKIVGLSKANAQFSPKGKYVIYYSPKQEAWLTYETASGITRNITRNVKVDWTRYLKDFPVSGKQARGIAGWLKDDKGILIYDENDIWLIDPLGEKPPKSITNGYGKKHSIVFALSMDIYYNKVFTNNERLILNAFNLTNKDNGFFGKSPSESSDPELLTMGPYLYDIVNNPYVPPDVNFRPSKAKEGEVYLVRRMKAHEAPNLFSTTDFKTFTQLTDVQPQKAYNWLTSELVEWKGLDGQTLQGIFYKPENFDRRKRYPIIFHYYDKRSDGLNAFLDPGFLAYYMNINIPWYVSRGYLVFVPDIHYKIGKPGASALSSVVSAAQYISKLPYVDAKKMGLQGGSFGGYETNYLVTHTNLFTAACTSSGIADLIGHSSGIGQNGFSSQENVEVGQFRIGTSLIERPDLYIENSPIFAVAKVTTPLLIMHTTKDDGCRFSDALAFFINLRRAGKRAWMLQYDEGNHGVWGKPAEDFNIRMQQFFDHYLKDGPAPKWMLEGIPAKMKDIDDGLELVREKDLKTGKWLTPTKGGLFTGKEATRVEALRRRKPITITLE